MTSRYFHTVTNQKKQHRQSSKIRKIRYNIRVPKSYIRKITKAEKIKQELKIKRKQALIRKLNREIKEDEKSLEYTDEMYIPIDRIVNSDNNSKQKKPKNKIKKTKKVKKKTQKTVKKVNSEPPYLMVLFIFSMIYSIISKFTDI